jgi:hypothetical protein
LAKIRLKIEVKTKTVGFHKIEFSDEVYFSTFPLHQPSKQKMFFNVYFIKRSWYNGQVLGWNV